MREFIDKAPGGPASDTLTLPFERRQKSRQRVQLDSGAEAAVMLPPGTRLYDGDVLIDAQGECVRVIAAAESLSCVRSADPLVLARAAYHLGNRHVPVQLGPGLLRYAHDHVLDDMLRQLGCTVVSERAAFEPEGGAYGGGHGHAHDHDHDHHHDHHHHSHD